MEIDTASEVQQELQKLLHLLNNQLTMANGYAQLLSLEPSLTPTLRPRADRIVQITIDAAHTLEQVQALIHLTGPEPPT
jgi:hypothetical protein